MNAGLDLAATKALLSAVARAVIANKDRLTKADQDIGDGDHGVGMARGFAAFEEAAARDFHTIQDLFRGCGQALMMNSGGASGVVFGTLFQGAGKSVKRDVFDAEALSSLLRADCGRYGPEVRPVSVTRAWWIRWRRPRRPPGGHSRAVSRWKRRRGSSQGCRGRRGSDARNGRQGRQG